MAPDFSLDAMLLLGFSSPIESNRKQHHSYQYPDKRIMELTVKNNYELSANEKTLYLTFE